MILISKIFGFLKEEKFAHYANKFFAGDTLHSSIVWRIHILSWAINHTKNLKGDFAEFGCYDGLVAQFLIEYNELDETSKNFFLFDIFDDPPTEKGEKHSPELYDEVSKRLKNYSCAKIIKGLLPDSFDEKKYSDFSFVHMDLNDASSELSVLEKIFEKVVSGGIIILDDYGHQGYEEQYKKEKEFFAQKNHSIVELPTGQGLVIKI
tara:strand:- start:183 stop:803 length:621 start_codon:yes stop_codon:yes gene_type:complete